MKEMLAGGTTLLYVSHDDTSVRNLCERALWLKKGGMVMAGGVEEVCAAYEASMSAV
jgi:ABC-type polysaccharide/polyol phosphate transport system ATPase subunit